MVPIILPGKIVKKISGVPSKKLIPHAVEYIIKQVKMKVILNRVLGSLQR